MSILTENRWIFILEGLATVLIAAASYFVIPDWPHNATFLTNEDRSMLSRRLALDVERATMNHWDKHTAKRCFADIKIWIGTFMYMGIVQTGYATSFFTPTILRQLGWTSIRAQVMSIPIFIVATVVALVTAYFTDRMKHRFSFIIAGCCIATIGYAILLSMLSVPVGARYFALYLITSGGYMAQPVTLVWLSNNVSGHYKRGVSSAMQVGLGNIGGKFSHLTSQRQINRLTTIYRYRRLEHLSPKTSTNISPRLRHGSGFPMDVCLVRSRLLTISEAREQTARRRQEK